jgi:signal peptidase I
MCSRNSDQRENGQCTAAEAWPAEARKLFSDVLARGARLRVKATGNSMAPFLKSGDILTIREVPRALLRRGDLILFVHDAGIPRVHRLIRKRRTPDGSRVLITKGDAFPACDRPIPERDVLGRVCGIERAAPGSGSPYIDLESPRWIAAGALIALAQAVRAAVNHLLVRLLPRSRTFGSR